MEGVIYFMVEFGSRLRKLRIENQLTQTQLAQLVGVQNSIISFYENGDRIPSPKTLRKLAATLHVTSDYLMGIEKKECIDVSGLNEHDKQIVRQLVEELRAKNVECQKVKQTYSR